MDIALFNGIALLFNSIYYHRIILPNNIVTPSNNKAIPSHNPSIRSNNIVIPSNNQND